MSKIYKAFTLVEMLIVMGIIIILMAVGIASGRFAIRRANKIEHQNAAEQIYQAAQSYYTDHREYPGKTEDLTVAQLMGEEVLGAYIDDFEGGSEATYSYAVDSSGQETLVCVTYGGVGDENDLGLYCTGNGINSTLLDGPSSSDIPYDDVANYNLAAAFFTANTASDWDPQSKTFSGFTEVNPQTGGDDSPPSPTTY